jgi:iron complex outermembrane receptor protein
VKGRDVYDNVWNGGLISRAGMFCEYHFSLSDMRMIMSGRLEINDAKATNIDPNFQAEYPENEKTEFNPSLSIGGTKYWNNDFSTGVWLGHAKRSGSITERYINSFPVGLDAYDMYGNPQLQAEINNQIDIILGYKTSVTSLQVSMFGSFLSNYISSVIDADLTPTMPTSPGVRRYVNIDDVFMTGFEIIWAQKLFADLKQKVSLAYTYAQDKVRNEPLSEIAPLDFRYSLSANYLANKLQPVFVFRHVYRQDRISMAFGETATPAFTLLDVGLTYNFHRSFGATLGINNLFDVAYYEHLNRRVKGQTFAIYAPGRNVYLTMFMDLM